MITTLFWAAAGLIGFTYVLFPLLILLRGRFARRPYKASDITPRVSVIITAYNEARRIGRRIDNVLALDYPQGQLEVLIASDGSDDGTDVIVGERASDGVRLLSLPRRGKAAALNAAVEASTGEILVFSDAETLYEREALRALVRPFADPEVGGVVGDRRYAADGKAQGSSEGELRYWDFDRVLKKAEGAMGNSVSASGAIYGIRRSLFQAVPDGVTDDFVTSTRVITGGKRLVFAHDAVALDSMAGSSATEFGRKVRIMTRGLRGVFVMRELLNPLHYGFYSVQLFWHKIMRRLMVFPLIILLVLNPLLLGEGIIYRLSMVAQIGLYGCSIAYLLVRGTRFGRLKVLAIPFFFCLVNAAALVATWNLVSGRRIDRWKPVRHR